MGQTKLRGTPVTTSGELPKVGSKAPPFTLARQDMTEATLETFAGKRKILSMFPSIDTGVCALSVKTFHEKVAGLDGVVVLNVSMDLPYAAKRFCGGEAITAETLSAFRSTFATDYGVRVMDGKMAGLTARAVVVLDEHDTVLHTELVDDIVHQPNYDAALAAASRG